MLPTTVDAGWPQPLPLLLNYAAMLAHPDAVVTALAPEFGSKVADFGAGAALHLAALSAAVGPNGRVYLVDVRKDMLERARGVAAQSGVRNADFVWADLDNPRATNLADSSLSRVLCSHLLFQVDSPATVIAEAFRVLAPGGRLLVVDWATPPGSVGGKLLPRAEAAALAAATGFVLPRDVALGGGQYAFLAEKPR